MAAGSSGSSSTGSLSAAIVPVALYEEVAERLRTRIFAHELEPGEWIDEQAIASEYGISRTPLREALKVLAAEGLVTLKPRRGCYVTELTERDLDEIFPVMALLESQCTREAVEKMTPEQFQRLEAAHADLEQSYQRSDVDRFFEANQAFHLQIQHIADNRWLAQIIADLRKVMKLRRRDSLQTEGRVLQSLNEHRAILEAIRRRNGDEAAQMMKAHLASGRQAASRKASARAA